MDNKTLIKVPQDKLALFCKKHHIRKLSLFGSILRQDFNLVNDIDVLVEFKKGHIPSFFRLFDMEDELSELFGGKKIDLRTPEDLSKYFRQEVLETAMVQYSE